MFESYAVPVVFGTSLALFHIIDGIMQAERAVHLLGIHGVRRGKGVGKAVEQRNEWLLARRL